METGVIVIDIPESTAAGDASRILSGPGESYFLVQVLPVQGAHRAYLRRYKQTLPSKAKAGDEDAQAIEYLRAHWVLKDRDVAKGCKDETGVDRSYKWFQRRRRDKDVPPE